MQVMVNYFQHIFDDDESYTQNNLSLVEQVQKYLNNTNSLKEGLHAVCGIVKRGFIVSDYTL